MLKINLVVLFFCVCCRAGEPDNLIEEIERKLEDLQSILGKSGETYIRWGKTSCPEESKLVYDGYAAGKRHNIGGSGANALCLPKIPEWKDYDGRVNTWTGRLYGIEYEIGQNKPYSMNFHDKDMPCAVCQSKRSTVLMVPGKVTCHTGWHKEFSGYLMSQASRNGRTPSEYICVDEKLDSVPGGDANRNEAVVYPVEAACGSLKCPPYVNGFFGIGCCTPELLWPLNSDTYTSEVINNSPLQDRTAGCNIKFAQDMPPDFPIQGVSIVDSNVIDIRVEDILDSSGKDYVFSGWFKSFSPDGALFHYRSDNQTGDFNDLKAVLVSQTINMTRNLNTTNEIGISSPIVLNNTWHYFSFGIDRSNGKMKIQQDTTAIFDWGDSFRNLLILHFQVHCE
ncbi:unnamed protein product [Mytilus edulis]|uniref:Uncharacterized protein n=1 Tax=Mytilus edulis TaxID=6550 RepID=A0A8S3RSB9_MYTED|nr:unnamed protein product [Mytilus edulis]